MVQEISDAAASARSIIHRKVRQSRSVRPRTAQQVKSDKDTNALSSDLKPGTVEENRSSPVNSTNSTNQSSTSKLNYY